MPSQETAELVERSRRGDAEAFGLLVARTHPKILSICLARLCHGDDAEDVAQDVFLRAWLELPALRDPARFDAWVATMARRLCINAGMAKARRRRVVTMLPPDALALLPVEAPWPSPRQAAARTEEEEQARAAVGSLPPSERELIALHYDHGLSLSEIGRLSGVETSTISRRLQKILARLRATTGQGLPHRVPAKHSPESTRRAAALASAFAMLPPSYLAALRLTPDAVSSPTSIGVLLLNGKKALVALAAALLVGTASTALLLAPSGRGPSAPLQSSKTSEVRTLPIYQVGQVLDVVVLPGETVRIPHAPNSWAIRDLELRFRTDGGLDFGRTYTGSLQEERYDWDAPLPTDLQLFYNMRPDSDALIMQAYLFEKDSTTGGLRIRYEARTSAELKTASEALERAYADGKARRDAVDAGQREIRMKLFPTDPKLLSLARAMYGLK